MEYQCVKLTHKLKNHGITSSRKYLLDHVYMHRPWCNPISMTIGLLVTATSYDDRLEDNVWDEIVFTYINLNCCTVEVWKWISTSHTS